jgi:hypothetical protein
MRSAGINGSSGDSGAACIRVLGGETPWMLGYSMLTIRILQTPHEEDLAAVSELMTGEDL